MKGSWHSYNDSLDDDHQGRNHGSRNQRGGGTSESTHDGKKSMQSSLSNTRDFLPFDMLSCDPVLKMAIGGNSSHTSQQKVVFIISWLS